MILAAGRGSRLGGIGLERPKGFIRLGDLPIVEESVFRLRRAGVREVVIVTWHLGHFYEDLARRYDGLVRLVDNPHFGDSGSMYSFSLARDLVQDDILLLESDIVYEQRALDELASRAAASVLLLSGPTRAGDEVFVAANARGELEGMSKDRSRLTGTIAGELVGITRLSAASCRAMFRYADTVFEETLHLDYEDCMVASTVEVPVVCHIVDDLIWGEIDDAGHLRRARESVYPAIVARDGPILP